MEADDTEGEEKATLVSREADGTEEDGGETIEDGVGDGEGGSASEGRVVEVVAVAGGEEGRDGSESLPAAKSDGVTDGSPSVAGEGGAGCASAWAASSSAALTTTPTSSSQRGACIGGRKR